MMRPAHMARRLAALEREVQTWRPRYVLVRPGEALPPDLRERDLVIYLTYEGAEDEGGTVCASG
jgi:hypothetical protein